MARPRQRLMRAGADEFGHYTHHCPAHFEAAQMLFCISGWHDYSCNKNEGFSVPKYLCMAIQMSQKYVN